MLPGFSVIGCGPVPLRSRKPRLAEPVLPTIVHRPQAFVAGAAEKANHTTAPTVPAPAPDAGPATPGVALSASAWQDAVKQLPIPKGTSCEQ